MSLQTEKQGPRPVHLPTWLQWDQNVAAEMWVAKAAFPAWVGPTSAVSPLGNFTRSQASVSSFVKGNVTELVSG